MLNGIIFVGSILLYRSVLIPLFRLIFSSTATEASPPLLVQSSRGGRAGIRLLLTGFLFSVQAQVCVCEMRRNSGQHFLHGSRFKAEFEVCVAIIRVGAELPLPHALGLPDLLRELHPEHRLVLPGTDQRDRHRVSAIRGVLLETAQLESSQPHFPALLRLAEIQAHRRISRVPCRRRLWYTILPTPIDRWIPGPVRLISTTEVF